MGNGLGFEVFKQFKQKNSWLNLFSLEYYFDKFAKYGLNRNSEAGSQRPRWKATAPQHQLLSIKSSNHDNGRSGDNAYSEGKCNRI